MRAAKWNCKRAKNPARELEDEGVFSTKEREQLPTSEAKRTLLPGDLVGLVTVGGGASKYNI